MKNEEIPTTDDIAAVQKQLKETCNDPNMVITCWSFTWCLHCNKMAGECKCITSPWNWSWHEQQEWYRQGCPSHRPYPLIPF